MDGDGRMLMMRVQDPNGAWKVCPEEPRLLVRRDPTEVGGEYYRLLPEGQIENYDGVTDPDAAQERGPGPEPQLSDGWRQEYEQPGAGPYPTSEPEAHNLTRFIAAPQQHCRRAWPFTPTAACCCGPMTIGTTRSSWPRTCGPMKRSGPKGTELTGYPAVSVYHDFRYHPNQVITGGFDGWLYEHLGLFGWTVEIWSPQRQAGIEEYKFIDWRREHPLEDDLKMLKWSDEVLEGKGYVDWYPFEHPQLGRGRVGRLERALCLSQPAAQLLGERDLALSAVG